MTSQPRILESAEWGTLPPAWTWDGVPPSQIWTGGVVPIQSWMGVAPISRMGYPCPDLGWGTTHLDLGWGTPLSRPGMGYHPTWTWDGVPPSCPDLRWGTPSPRKCEQTENITFPHPSDAGSNNDFERFSCICIV